MLITNYDVYIICLSIDMDPITNLYLEYDNCRTLGMSIEGYICTDVYGYHGYTTLGARRSKNTKKI